MNYHVVFSAQAKKSLKKLDRHIYAMIIAWIRRNLEGCSNPRLHGKGLTANRSGQWRYRVNDYRLIGGDPRRCCGHPHRADCPST